VSGLLLWKFCACLLKKKYCPEITYSMFKDK
jgi:hypothetical protein